MKVDNEEPSVIDVKDTREDAQASAEIKHAHFGDSILIFIEDSKRPATKLSARHIMQREEPSVNRE